MKNRTDLRPFLIPLVLLALPAASFAQTAFADQTLAVVSVGDGTSALAFAASPVTLVNYAKTGGAQLGSVSLPIFSSGASARECTLLSDGGDPRSLYLAGYSNTTVGTDGLVLNSTGAQNPRRVVRFDTRTGAVTSTTLGPNDFSRQQIYSAQTIGSTILASGGNLNADALANSIRTGTFNGGSTTLNEAIATDTSNNVSVSQNLGGTTYYSARGNIYTGANFTGSVFGANASGLASPGKFLFTDPNTLYVADLGGGGINAGGLFRATRGADGAFTTAVKLGSVPALRQLAYDGSSFYGTTSETSNNSLLSFDLNGGSVTTLATAGANRAFRGVEVVPEPASLAALAVGAALLRRRKRRA